MYSGNNSGYNSGQGGYSSGQGYSGGGVGGYSTQPPQGYAPQNYGQSPQYNPQQYPPSYNNPPYNQQPTYNQQPPYNQPPPYNQAPPYNQPPSYNQAPPYNQPPSYPPSQYPPSAPNPYLNQAPMGPPPMAPPPMPTQPMGPPPIVPQVVTPVVQPTIVPEPIISLPNAQGYVYPDFVTFQSADKDCEILHYAMKGLGTDERTIINIICSRDATQRAAIRRRYIALYGKDLIKKLKSELSGNFEDTCVGLFMTPPEYDAYCLYKAMKGLGTSEGVLIEILGTRNNQEIQMIKAEFLKNYGKPLEKWISSETSGHFRKLLISIIQANRSMNPIPDPVMCQNDARALYIAGEGRWGTDESTFIRIFTQRSGPELDLISRQYQQLRGNTLHHAIDKEFSSDTKELLHTILVGIQNPSAYFARRIRESVEGIGTNDSRLIRVIVSRCEIDMPLIKQEYRRLYGRDLLHDVREDTSGNYKKILTHLIARV